MKSFRTLRSLRFRLTMMYVVVFGVVQTGLFLVLEISREGGLRREFDVLLYDRAETIVTRLRTAADDGNGPDAAPLLQQALNEALSPGVYCQIRFTTPDEAFLASDNLGAGMLPLSAEAEQAARRGERVYETLGRAFSESVLNEPGRDFRLLTIFVPRSPGPYFLQVCRSMGSLDEAVSDFRTTLYLFLALGLGAATVASLVLARHTLMPIGEIAREAQRITARRLDVRLTPRDSADEVDEMVNVINDMLDRLETSFRSQERLLGDISHELKTPITVLRGQAQSLHRREATLEQFTDFSATVLKEMDRMNDVVDSFLALTRAEERLARDARSTVAISDVMVEAVANCQEIATRRNVRLVPMLPDVEDDTPQPVIEGDAHLLRIMIENLVRNAKKYSPSGGVVEILLAVTPSEARITVTDQGPGIPDDQLERVFERTYRVPREGRDVKGVGLGLAIARRIAQLHAGDITATNRPGGGCRFEVRLPLGVVDDTDDVET